LLLFGELLDDESAVDVRGAVAAPPWNLSCILEIKSMRFSELVAGFCALALMTGLVGDALAGATFSSGITFGSNASGIE
jgi:hypothetical protein